MDITPYLHLMVEKTASDLFFSTGAPVSIKVEGKTTHIGDHPLPDGETKRMAYSLLSDRQIAVFEEEMELDFAISVKDEGRFRVNIFRQRGEVAMVIRFVKSLIPTTDELHLPALLNDLVMAPRGLILVVGTTGCGKSTTLASMIDHRNHSTTGHILTIEDPIEFVHRHQQSVVNQREIGSDTKSYAAALKRAMREAPDVILIGEIRDRETMEQAISYAQTGHLCLSTLHASNANQTMERIINFFPPEAHRQLFMDLSLNLTAVVSQRLVRGLDGLRYPAVEVLLNSPYVAELIDKGDVGEIKEAMKHSTEQGMQTFDQALFELYNQGRIDLDEALNNADSRNDLGLKIRLGKGAARPEDISIEE
jgi:twitching motility protein PilU